jgi:Glycosyl transferase family 2
MRRSVSARKAPGRPLASPAVSVVMSVYNGERFLREAVESVLDQSLDDLELVVVDDGSTDSTPQILDECGSSDSRVVVYRQVNQGRAVALNRGVGLARAPLIARLDADDVALSNRLENQRQFLAEHESVAVVGGAVTFVDEGGRPFADVPYPLTDPEIRKAAERRTPFSHPSVMLRKNVFGSIGGYRPIFVEAEDVDLWLRIAERYELANLPERVIQYRMHAGQATVQKLELQTLCAVAARVAARARMEGRPDPLDAVERIDFQTLIAMGATRHEIASALVYDATWLAKTMGRAGYEDATEELFAAARHRARSGSGSPELVAHVHRERAHRDVEQGHRLRAKLRRMRAVLAERAAR